MSYYKRVKECGRNPFYVPDKTFDEDITKIRNPFYVPVKRQDEDITNKIQQRVTIYVQRMLKDGYIDEKTKQYLIQTNVKPGCFYILPKIQWTQNRQPGTSHSFI